MEKIRIEEVFGRYDKDLKCYQLFSYKLDDWDFEYDIQVHWGGTVICNNYKLNMIIPKEKFHVIMENKDERLKFMNKLVISVDENKELPMPYISKCITSKDLNAFDIEKNLVKFKDEWVDLRKKPDHADNAELKLVNYDYEQKIITVFNYPTKTLYTSTISADDLFEVENKPYSVHLFVSQENEIISLYEC